MMRDKMADNDKYDIIPASLRPDGTWRKEVKIKKGYIPPDEVKKFETKGTKFRESQIPGFIPGMDPADMPAKKETKSKNQKRNENKKKKKEAGGEGDEEEDQPAAAAVGAKEEPAPAAAAAAEDPKEALAKKIRNTKKKVRQTDELQQKVASGEISANAEQQEKLSKRAELEKEITELEKELAKL